MQAPSVAGVAPVTRLDPDPADRPGEGQRVRVTVEGTVERGRHDGTQAYLDLPGLGHVWVGRAAVTVVDPGGEVSEWGRV